jgi:excisionase family DNA binding protein
MSEKANQDPPSRCFDLRDAAKFLRVSRQTVRALVRKGKLRAIRSGPRSKLLVDIRELESYIERNTQSNDAGEEVK